jgi:hypothetical protein
MFAHQHYDLAIVALGHLPQQALLEFQAAQVRYLSQQEGFHCGRGGFGG